MFEGAVCSGGEIRSDAADREPDQDDDGAVVVEREDSHDRVKITRKAVRTAGSKVGILPKGKKVQLEALLNGLLLVSGNDAAVALALHTPTGCPDSYASWIRGQIAWASLAHVSRLLTVSRTGATAPVPPISPLLPGRTSLSGGFAGSPGVSARSSSSRSRAGACSSTTTTLDAFRIRGSDRVEDWLHGPRGRSIVATAQRGRRELGVVLLHSYNAGRPGEAAARPRLRDAAGAPPRTPVSDNERAKSSSLRLRSKRAR